MTEDNQSSNRPMILLPSGKLVQSATLTLDANEHTPEHLLEWLEKVADQVPPEIANFKRKICTDKRMHVFWSWIGAIRFENQDWARSSLTVSDQIRRSTRIPGKPGDMTPNQRQAYFKKVRTHTKALQELLEDTRFDFMDMSAVSERQLNRPLSSALRSWGVEEQDEGHVVAYQVTPEGQFQHHYSYPENALTEILGRVMEWTYWNDNWDGGIGSTSAPIAQSNSERMPIIYFCCTLFDWFKRNGVEIPFPILATVANVALDLTADDLVDEDTVRKQVRRYQKRKAG